VHESKQRDGAAWSARWANSLRNEFQNHSGSRITGNLGFQWDTQRSVEAVLEEAVAEFKSTSRYPSIFILIFLIRHHPKI